MATNQTHTVKHRLGRYLLAAVITVAYAAFAGCEAAPNEPPEVVFVSPGPDGYGTLIMTPADVAAKRAAEAERWCPQWLSPENCSQALNPERSKQ